MTEPVTCNKTEMRKLPNESYDPTPCCEKWKFTEGTYYCKVHMNFREGKFIYGWDNIAHLRRWRDSSEE